MGYSAALVRAISVLTSAAAGIVGIRASLSLGPGQSTTLIALLSWIAFIPIAQFGYGRPLYAALRSRHVNGRLGARLVGDVLRLSLWQAMFAVAFFCALAIWLASQSGFAGPLSSLLGFAIGIAAIGASGFLRDVSYAVSREASYEAWELARRLALLSCLLGLGMGLPLPLLGLACALVAWGSSRAQALRLRRAGTAAGEESLSEQQPGLARDARRYLAFSIFELVLYNAPLVVYTLLSTSAGIVEFAIWTKLFMIVVLPMRIVADARINAVTAYFFAGDKGAARRSLNLTVALALLTTSAFVVMVAIGQDRLLQLIAPGYGKHDPWLIGSLAAWAGCNAIQHVYGSFTVSHGLAHGFASRASAASCLAVLAVVTSAALAQLSLSATLLLAAIPYALGATAYAVHAYRSTTTHESASH